MPRAVLDPNVLVSALITPGGDTAELLDEMRSGAFELIASDELLGELAEVLTRDKFRRYVTRDEVAVYVELIRSQAVFVAQPAQISSHRVSDPSDQYLVDLLESTDPDALVSGDPHLSSMRPTLRIQTPSEFLTQLRSR